MRHRTQSFSLCHVPHTLYLSVHLYVSVSLCQCLSVCVCVIKTLMCGRHLGGMQVPMTSPRCQPPPLPLLLGLSFNPCMRKHVSIQACRFVVAVTGYLATHQSMLIAVTCHTALLAAVREFGPFIHKKTDSKMF